jgi:UDP:flavonoid glycosyltransferase YjiC (YdhE family)
LPDILIASVPIHGHVAPLLAVATGLVERGHRVRFLAGSRFEAAVRATGASFTALPAGADFDDRNIADRHDDGDRMSGVKALRRDLTEVFLKPARFQYQGLIEQLRQPTDVVLTDPAFVGAIILAGHPSSQRPALIGCGVLPLSLSSRYVAPFGLGIGPLRGPAGLARNALLRVVSEKVIFGREQRQFDELYREVHGRRSGTFAFNWFRTTDAVVQFSVPAFEYPRPDASTDIRFIGPATTSLPAALPGTADLPSWWDDLGGTRAVVHVTQGTIANLDFTELVRPTLDALADENVLVVASTGGRPVEELGTLPDNARAAEFLPYDQLLPLTSAMVTNGGYGGVHYALQHGVPIVIAGDTEDKPEVAARVAWSGVGVNLRRGRPQASAIHAAVREVLTEPRYRRAAERVAEQIRAAPGIDGLHETITEVLAARAKRE